MSYISLMGSEARHERKNDMTQQEQTLADDKVRAEIAKLVAETSKINTENQWYVAIVASTATLAIVAVVKLFL